MLAVRSLGGFYGGQFSRKWHSGILNFGRRCVRGIWYRRDTHTQKKDYYPNGELTQKYGELTRVPQEGGRVQGWGSVF